MKFRDNDDRVMHRESDQGLPVVSFMLPMRGVFAKRRIPSFFS